MKQNPVCCNSQTHTIVVYILMFDLKTKLLTYLFFSFSYTSFSCRKIFLKQKSTTNEVIFSKRSESNKDQTVTTDDPHHYQELRVSQQENTYQTLHQQWLSMTEPLSSVNFMCICRFKGMEMWLQCSYDFLFSFILIDWY